MNLDKRYIIVTLPVTVVLLVVGWLIAPHLLVLTSDLLGVTFAFLDPGDVFVPVGLTIVLFGLCAPMAAALLWAYSRNRSAQFSFVRFWICLLISLTSACLGMLARALILRLDMMTLGMMGHIYDVWIYDSSILWWGIGAVLLICGGCTFIFLALSVGQNSKVNGSD